MRFTIFGILIIDFISLKLCSLPGKPCTIPTVFILIELNKFITTLPSTNSKTGQNNNFILLNVLLKFKLFFNRKTVFCLAKSLIIIIGEISLKSNRFIILDEM